MNYLDANVNIARLTLVVYRVREMVVVCESVMLVALVSVGGALPDVVFWCRLTTVEVALFIRLSDRAEGLFIRLLQNTGICPVVMHNTKYF